MKLASSSSSWNALVRVLYRLIFGNDTYETLLRQSANSNTNWNSVGEDGPSLNLRIGNDALPKHCSFRHYYD